MLLPRRILFGAFVCVLFLLLMLADVRTAGRMTEAHVHRAETAGETESRAVQLSSLHVEDAPSVEVLLLRLQEIQALLDIHQGDGARALSASLFSLSLGIRQRFDGYLFVPYEQLRADQKESYVEVIALILDLEEVLYRAEATGSAKKAALHAMLSAV